MLKSFIVILSLVSLNLWASRGEVGLGPGNGGSEAALAWINLANKLITVVEKNKSNFSEVDLEQLRKVIDTTKIIFKKQITRPDDERVVTALNFPKAREIHVDYEGWKKMSSDVARMVLQFHEYLGIMKMEQGTYHISGRLSNILAAPVTNQVWSIFDGGGEFYLENIDMGLAYKVRLNIDGTGSILVSNGFSSLNWYKDKGSIILQLNKDLGWVWGWKKEGNVEKRKIIRFSRIRIERGDIKGSVSLTRIQMLEKYERKDPNDKGTIFERKLLEDRENNLYVNGKPNKIFDIRPGTRMVLPLVQSPWSQHLEFTGLNSGKVLQHEALGHSRTYKTFSWKFKKGKSFLEITMDNGDVMTYYIGRRSSGSDLMQVIGQYAFVNDPNDVNDEYNNLMTIHAASAAYDRQITLKESDVYGVYVTRNPSHWTSVTAYLPKGKSTWIDADGKNYNQDFWAMRAGEIVSPFYQTTSKKVPTSNDDYQYVKGYEAKKKCFYNQMVNSTCLEYRTFRLRLLDKIGSNMYVFLQTTHRFDHFKEWVPRAKGNFSINNRLVVKEKL